jgi:hypothetical protein
MEFDTFKGTNKQSSSGRGLSEFTINKTVSNLDPKQESKGVISSIDNRPTDKINQESRKAMSQENNVGFFTKIKNSVFGSEKKKDKSGQLEVVKASSFESKQKQDEPKVENDYAIDFFENKNVEDKPENKPVEESKKDNKEVKVETTEQISESMMKIMQPNDISIINLTKKTEKKASPVFQSPSKVVKKEEGSSKKKSTGKDMSFRMWGQNSINALKKDINK